MEYLSGDNLEDIIKHLKKETTFLPWALAIALCAQAAFALSIAHAQGFVHKDVKPNNIYLCDRGNRVAVKFIDWGVAAKHGTPGVLGSGTDRYGAPELLMRRSTSADAGDLEDVQSDIFSLGLTCYELITLYHAFFEHRADFVYAHLHESPTPLHARRPDAPAGLEDLLTAMLSKNPAERPSAADVAKRLDALAAREGYRDVNAPLLELLASMKGESSVRRRKAGEPTEVKAKGGAKSEVFFKPSGATPQALPSKTEELDPAQLADILGDPPATEAAPAPLPTSTGDTPVFAHDTAYDAKLPFADEQVPFSSTDPGEAFAVIDEDKGLPEFRSMADVFKEIEAIETEYQPSPFEPVVHAAPAASPIPPIAATERMPVRAATHAPAKAAMVEVNPPKVVIAPAAPAAQRLAVTHTAPMPVVVAAPAVRAHANVETVEGALIGRERKRRFAVLTAWIVAALVAVLTVAGVATYRGVFRRPSRVALTTPEVVVARAPANPAMPSPSAPGSLPLLPIAATAAASPTPPVAASSPAPKTTPRTQLTLSAGAAREAVADAGVAAPVAPTSSSPPATAPAAAKPDSDYAIKTKISQ